MGKTLAFVYGLICYLLFFVTFLYTIGFAGNLVVPKTIASGEAAPFGQALLVNALLLGLLAVQHSGMARPGFNKWWTRYVPQPVERSTYVLLTSLALMLLFWQWRPMTDVVWNVENPAGRYIVWAFFVGGWATVLTSTFLINHFDLFGVRQMYLYKSGREYTDVRFVTPLFYKVVRHPIMLGFIIAFWVNVMFGDAGYLQALIHRADLEQHAFEHVWFMLQSS